MTSRRAICRWPWRGRVIDQRAGAPLTVVFTDGSGSTDQDGTIASYAWNFGDGLSSPRTSNLANNTNPGTYTATLTVTDNRGGTGTASTQIVVSQNPALVMHVGSITMALVQGASGTSAQATVRIVNGNGQPVQGATVSGNWTGLMKSSSTATTDASGNAVLTSKGSRKKGTFTIAITGVARSGYTSTTQVPT